MDEPEVFNDSDFEEFRPALQFLARSQLGVKLRRVLDDSDIVQQTLLEAHAAHGAIRGKSREAKFAWLRRVLTNTIVDHVRKHTRRKRNVEREVELEAQVRRSALRAEQWLTDRSSSPVERAERNEQLQSLATALLSLPDSQREAIELYYLQGCTVPEMERLMDRTGASIAGLIQRGVAKLRRVMNVSDPVSSVAVAMMPAPDESESSSELS
jgi:RNA polymerase sigma-70 factor (subfamily 1)